MKIKAINDYVFLNKCIREERVKNIIIPERSRELTSFMEIIDVGDKCKYYKKEHIGKFTRLVLHPTKTRYADGMFRIMKNADDEIWAIKEKLLDMIIYE